MKAYLRILSALTAVWLGACTQQVAVNNNSSTIKINRTHLNEKLNEFITDGKLVGASALIYQQDQEVYFGAFGQANRETKQAMTRDTLVQIYSMTKPVVGVALMQLYEQGKFKLKDPIAKYIPELSDLTLFDGLDKHGRLKVTTPRRQPMVLDFMRHTVGLGEENTEGPVGELWRKLDPTNLDNTYTEVATKIGQIPLIDEPGSVWRYGPSVEIQALLVERLSGQPLLQYLQKNIFIPLGMKHTGYFVEPYQRLLFAKMYQMEQEKITEAPPYYATRINLNHWARDPGGFGLVSTLDDYMRFARMLVNGGTLDGVQILKPQTITLMATDYLGESIQDRAWLGSKGRVGFGLDFAVRVEKPQAPNEFYGFVGEFFWDGYATTIFWVDPTNKLAVVFFTQMIPHQVDIHKQLRDAVYGFNRRF